MVGAMPLMLSCLNISAFQVHISGRTVHLNHDCGVLPIAAVHKVLDHPPVLRGDMPSKAAQSLGRRALLVLAEG